MRSSLFPANNKLQSILPSSNMTRRSEDVPLTQTSMIPDMEGWLYKQGDRYKNWNKRWFVLKGINLFYFKSPKVITSFGCIQMSLTHHQAVQMKGIINLRGYRVEPDSSIQTGKYCFKLQHEKERTFYFYTDQEKYMKDWVKAIMKSTIERDYGSKFSHYSLTSLSYSVISTRHVFKHDSDHLFGCSTQNPATTSFHLI
jgi:hypothetical protein